jgi:hypothetical protein
MNGKHARVHKSKIYCDKGHPIATQTGKSFLDLRLLAQGRRLAMAYCQEMPGL